MIAVVEVMRDVTESRSLQEEVMLRNRELSALNEVLLAASESLELDRVLGLVTADHRRRVRRRRGRDPPRAAGGRDMWHAGLELPQPPLRDLLRDVSRNGHGGDVSPEPVIFENLADEVAPAHQALVPRA